MASTRTSRSDAALREVVRGTLSNPVGVIHIKKGKSLAGVVLDFRLENLVVGHGYLKHGLGCN